MRIILNADDFGGSPDTLAATVAGLERGALTSASIMPGMPETEAAIAFARSRPDLGFGVHLVFVGDGAERPLAPAAQVPSLVDAHGRFLPAGTIRRLALLGRLPVGEIEREAAAQIAFVQDRGVPVSHVDSHRHVHKLAPFREALGRVLPRFSLSRVRNVQDVYLGRPVRRPTYWLGPAWKRRLEAVFDTTSHFYMPSSRRDVQWAEALLGAIARLPGGTLEVGVHPGHADEWRRAEAAEAGRLAELARAAGHELVGWRDLPGRQAAEATA